MFRQVKTNYTEEFKSQAIPRTSYIYTVSTVQVSAFQKGNETLPNLAQRLGVNRHTLHSWVYNRGISSKSSKKPILAVSNFEDVKEEKLPPEAMEVLIKELKSQLAYEKMRSESFLKMIEIAERELKIDIRKKSGAKQSLK